MRWLFKIFIKFALFGIMMVLMAVGLKYGRPYIMKAAGMPEMPGGTAGMPSMKDAHFSSDESDLMGTVLKSALQLFTGTKSRNELANGLSDKLYAGRMDGPGMSELGIQLDKKPVKDPAAPGNGPGLANAQPSENQVANQTANPSTNPTAPRAAKSRQQTRLHLEESAENDSSVASAGGKPPALSKKDSDAAMAQIQMKAKAHLIDLGIVLVLIVAMLAVIYIRRRTDKTSFVPPSLAIQGPAESDPMEMTHTVHSLKTEEFELLVALIYQRQGYRVSLPAALGGEGGINFTLARKAERVLVQCKRLSLEHKVPVDRLRELHEAVLTAGATRGIFVASCGFTWDARNFGKAKGITLVNARTLDSLLTAVREKSDEDLLMVSQWAPKFLSKVELKTPTCPSCEAQMDELSVSDSAVWVCSDRPECRGRRSGRKHRKPAAAKKADQPATKRVDKVSA